MDSSLINAIVAEFGLDLLKFNDEIRLGTLSSDNDTADDVKFVKHIYSEASKCAFGRSKLAENAKLMADKIQEHIFVGKPADLPFISGAYETYLDKHNIDLPPIDSNDEKELMSALAQTAKLVYIIEQERVQGIRDESDLQRSLITQWKAELPPPKDTGMPVSELLDKHYAVWEKDYRKKPNLNEYRITRKLRDIEIIKESMLDHFGKDIGIKEIDDDKASGWRDFHQDDNQLSNSSVNKYLEHVTAAFKWAADRQRKYVEFNPFERTRLPEGVKREKTREFSPEELQQYINMLADTYLPEFPENVWIPLIILYEGMRNNEIAQLFVDDIQEKDGIPFIRILDSNVRNQRTKVEASQRNLPLHSKLIELGFLAYVQKMKDVGQTQLFPNCVYNERTGRYYDDNLSARLNTIVDSISTDKKLRVYSLRANFKTAIDDKFSNAAIDAMEGKTANLNVAGLEKFVSRAFDDVMGHVTKGGTGETTYRKVQLRLMQRIVEQAEYPINIEKLKSAFKV